MKKILTLCLVIKDNHILLGHKKRGFGEGYWNGFGGKVEAEETIEEAAKRELYEEAGIQAMELNQQAILTFKIATLPEILEGHVFRVTEFSGTPHETEEMNPKWFSLSEIPFSQMWKDDIYWFPYFLAGKTFVGDFIFKDNETLHEYRITEVDTLSGR